MKAWDMLSYATPSSMLANNCLIILKQTYLMTIMHVLLTVLQPGTMLHVSELTKSAPHLSQIWNNTTTAAARAAATTEAHVCSHSCTMDSVGQMVVVHVRR